MASDSPTAPPSVGGIPAQRNRSVGYVVECDGTQARIATVSGLNAESEDYWAVGQLISITIGKNRVVGLLYKIESDTPTWNRDKPNRITLCVELAGEVRSTEHGTKFSTGISTYPHLGAVAHRIRKEDLVTIYKSSDPSSVTIGSLSQSRDIPAVISVDALLSRHFSVVGTTGTGKSTAVTLILHMIAERKKNQRILILDPHNEYTSAFANKSHTITAESLDLPFWLLTLEEFTHVIFRGREQSGEEIDALREFIPRAKQIYKTGRKTGIRRMTTSNAGITADTPLPYRLADLLGLLEDEIGSLDGAMRRLTLRRLKARLEAAINDPRFAFLFGSHNATDRIEDVLGEIYRIPLDGKPITVFQMSGIPSEVVNSVASVLCRLAFDLALASESKIKTLVVCEEAHRYIPADTSSGFAPTRSAIARIAKEGRKYGVSLAIITQRPNELDPTILSQCNTIFSLRLGNDSDQDVMRKAISNGSRSTLAFLSSLADRECIAFGSAVSTPMRMMFRNVPAHIRPSSQQVTDGEAKESVANTSLSDIVTVLRGAGGAAEDEETDTDPADWVVTEDAEQVPDIEAFAEPEPEPLVKRRSSLLRRKS